MINPLGSSNPINPNMAANEVQKAQESKNIEPGQTQDIAKTGAKDEIELSSLAKDAQTVLKNIDSKEAARSQLVNSLREQVKNNTYQIDSEKIANKMLQNPETSEFL